MTTYQPRSVRLGNIMQAALLLSVLAILAFAVKYIFALADGTDGAIAQYLMLKSHAITLIPFVIVILLFIASLWAYSFYVDLNNVYTDFSYHPNEAMFGVLIPVYNIYGIGRTFSRVINFLDRYDEDDTVYGLGMQMKIALATFYAGFAGALVSILFSTTIPSGPDMVWKPTVIVFNFAEIVVLLFTLVGFFMVVRANSQLIRYRISS